MGRKVEKINKIEPYPSGQPWRGRACKTRAVDGGILSTPSSSSRLPSHRSLTCCLENPENRAKYARGPTPRRLSGNIGCEESTARLGCSRSMEWWCWFFEQNTQSLSFGSGSGGSRPLGYVKARGGNGQMRRQLRLSVPFYLTRHGFKPERKQRGL